MSKDDVLVHRDGAVGWITLNRPKKRNAQGVDFTQTLLAALDEVENDPDIDVAVLTGAGSVFAGGGDLKEIMSVDQQDPEWEFELIRGYNKIVSRLYYFDRPIIAAVNGPAVGGGACLGMACDFAIASDKASYHFAFGRIGLAAADMGATFFLQRHLGAARAAHLTMTGATVDANEGKALGLFSQVVPGDQLILETQKVAQSIADQSRRANTISKLSMRRAMETNLDAALEYEAYLQAFAFGSKGHKQRLGQFLNPGKKG